MGKRKRVQTAPADPVEQFERQAEANDNVHAAYMQCFHGMAVLAFMAQTEGDRTDDILRLEGSFVTERLQSLGRAVPPDVLSAMQARALSIEPSVDEMIAAAQAVAADIAYFTQVFGVALKIHRRQRAMAFNPFEPLHKSSATLDLLRESARRYGWLNF